MCGEKLRKVKTRLNVLLLLMVLVYAPFIIYLGSKYDIFNRSLSSIGWRNMGADGGLVYLFFYVFFVVPVVIYQGVLFRSLSGVKAEWPIWLLCIGGGLMILGASIPCGYTSPKSWQLAHNTLCQIGTLVAVIPITYMVHKSRVKGITPLYYSLLAMSVIGFFILYTAAILELIASFFFMAVMFVINIAMFANAAQELDNTQENVINCLYNDIEKL